MKSGSPWRFRMSVIDGVVLQLGICISMVMNNPPRRRFVRLMLNKALSIRFFA